MTMERNSNQNCYLNVRTDSENDLEALFNVVQSASTTIANEPSSNSLPMKLRKLPPSFFKQPKGLDSNKLSPEDNTGLKISHSRAHSSPASLPIPTSSAGMYSIQPPSHTRTQSYDGTAFEESQLPPGWEMRTSPSGQPYFMDHIQQITTWVDPRKTQSTNNLTSSNPLPDGWEQAITPEGEIYYINHLTRTTSWVDPRIAMAPCRTNPQQHPPQQGRRPPQQHKAMLERVQLEQEQLKKRQQELQKQEILLKHGLLENGGSKSMLGNLVREAGLAQLAPQPDTTTPNGHIRDESFDSGLGMNTGYSNTYNSDIDLNTGSDSQMFDANYNSKDTSSRNSSRLPDFFDNLPGTNVDFGTIEGESTPSAMDTDDLGVGLDLPTDMLNDVESVLTPNLSKMTDPNFLTWL
ncbi:transcriptional coactivator YAP1 [Exaiptasia diaphana]|uniref:WW domain-containing protein n=1 Tax=Exaiptasia diaphana TaxID=2652724 RepID=A0A913XDY3_EXADI|nr:transcriptional coactivator YAP1 [Exaiptasia diaphana]XP_020903682.1 transcriptional coactivator YAP1 [Exaiptasia diaphana]KXJ26190.1 Transcriptional coactivator YAP1 [Exaiptasia diaphana]KXJ29823.1 Transcriptional coactivator YAP1 [Exaiptasia diaphana]